MAISVHSPKGDYCGYIQSATPRTVSGTRAENPWFGCKRIGKYPFVMTQYFHTRQEAEDFIKSDGQQELNLT